MRVLLSFASSPSRRSLGSPLLSLVVVVSMFSSTCALSTALSSYSLRSVRTRAWIPTSNQQPGIVSGRSRYHSRLDAFSLFATRSATDKATDRSTLASPTKTKRSKTQLKVDLKQYRTQQSAPLGRPAYTVFSNAVLDEIYARLPTTLEELLDIKGIGPKKLDMFGEDILSIVAQYTDGNGEPRTTTPATSGENNFRPSAIDPKTLTAEQKRAASLLLSVDRPNVFVSGSAGTGKSHVLKYIVQEMQQGRLQSAPKSHQTSSTSTASVANSNEDDDDDDNDDNEFFAEVVDVSITEIDRGSSTSITNKVRVGVCAPTGVAAIHVGGNTLHSFFGIGLGTGSLSKLVQKVKRNNEAQRRIDETDTLIIDECSMMSSDLLEILDAVVRQARKEGEFAHQPFGGMQVICFGDFFQLPPIAPGPDKPFCFESPVWSELGFSNNMVELQEVQRQDHRDFVDLLNRVRLGQIDQHDIHGLNARCVISKRHPLPTDGIVPTRLYTHNKDVDAENEARLAELKGKEVVCLAQDKWKESMPVGTLASVKKKMAEGLSKEMPDQVRLKVGAQVMLTRNKDLDRNLVNGSRGVVIRFEPSKDGDMSIPVVRFDCGVVTSITPVEAVRYNPDGGAGCLARMQVPLKLAWAVTVHKSQGTTLTRALLDISSAFDYGQCYVALSRVRSLEGLWLVRPARPDNIKVGIGKCQRCVQLSDRSEQIFELGCFAMTVNQLKEISDKRFDCGGRGVITRHDVPVVYNPTYTKEYGQPVEVEILDDYKCEFCNGDGKTIDKLEAGCDVSVEGTTLTVLGDLNMGDHITFTGIVTDAMQRLAVDCNVCVTKRGKNLRHLRKNGEKNMKMKKKEKKRKPKPSFSQAETAEAMPGRLGYKG